MVSSTLCPAVHILGSQNVYGRAEGIANHYWPWSVFSSYKAVRQMKHCSTSENFLFLWAAAHRGLWPIPAVSEPLPPGSKPLLAGSKPLFVGSVPIPASSEVLSAGSEALPISFETLSPTGPLPNHYQTNIISPIMKLVRQLVTMQYFYDFGFICLPSNSKAASKVLPATSEALLSAPYSCSTASEALSTTF